MLGIIRKRMPVRALTSFLMAMILGLSLISCGDRAASEIPGSNRKSSTQVTGSISEVAPPEAIQQLRPKLDGYQPQVTILSPQADEVLQDTTVSARFQVQDLPIFKNPNLEMGPHLHVIVDNQPYTAVYDLAQPLVLKDLAPGTHTLRVFASRPWHESFKNEGAYAQTTFHIFTKSTDNNPDPAQALLTYSRPQGRYGAEPIMLDFYLTNAPLHLVAQENPNDEIADWRIRVTINGQSFVLDKWQPIYLKGFKPGKNWVQLEFLNELGNPVKNVFNDTVRLITYELKGQDTLSKLVRGDLSAADARGIVDPTYAAKPLTPIVAPTPSSEASPALSTPTPSVEVTPSVEPSPAEVEATPSPIPAIAEPKTKTPKFDGIFNRFRRPAASPSSSPTLPEIVATPTPEPVAPSVPEVSTPEASATPSPAEEGVPPQPLPTASQAPEKAKSGLFSRFRRPTVTPSPSPTLPEIVVTPAPEPVAPSIPEASATPSPEAEALPEPQPLPTVSQAPEKAKSGLFSRFRRSTVTPSPLLRQPEVIQEPTPVTATPKPELSPSPETALEVTPPSEASEKSKEELAPKTTAEQTFRIIQSPNPPTVPSRYLRKSAPTASSTDVSPSETPTDIELEEAGVP